MNLKDRILGCILGGALGDAWGGPWEGRFGPVQFQIPVRPTLSDDTELTLATCESVIETGAIEPESVATHFLMWFKAGRIHGIGSSTLKAMRDLSAGTHWALSGAQGEFAAGNGAAMRIAPLAFLIDPNKPDQRVIIRDVCRITHHNEEAYVGALAVVLAIHAVLTGEWSTRQSFLACVAGSLPDSAVRDRILEMLPLEISIEQLAHRFSTSGYVVDTVPFALYCAQSIAHEDLEVVLSRTISAGGDTDTIGSITGQIAGTVAGVGGLPHAPLADIEQSEQVGLIAHNFADVILRRNPTFEPSFEK